MTTVDASLAADLWYFRIAGESPSFRVAAERLSVTQGAVTQRIQRLEARLGVQLFRRGERYIRLSPQGKLLFEAARHGFDEISEALARLRSKQDRATVRVSCVPSLALEWLTPRLACFIEQHSDVHIEIFGEWFDIDRSRMTAEGVDIAIRYSQELTGEAPVAFSFAEMIYPVVSPRLKTQLFECQETERCVSLLHDACPWDHAIPTVEWDYWLSTYGMPWNASRRDLFFNLAQLAYRSAIEGVGVAMGRNMIVKHHVSKGLLVPALDDAPLQVTALHVLTQSDRPSGPTAIVLDWLHEQMEIT